MAGEKETTTTKTTQAVEEQQQQQQWWGTSDELLLACAVSRHGTRNWDSIAMEVQNRTSTMSSLTPKSCEDKFHDLTRRFGFPSQNNAESGGGRGGGGGSFSVVPALVDHLRRIRVQELRAEVRRCDVSIVSLEMKVKRLEEERERSEKADADPERETKALPQIGAGKSSAVDADSDERENRSFNESNSMTQKPETTTNKEQNDAVLDVGEREPTKVKSEPGAEARPVLDEPDRDRGWSSNGKLNGTGNVKDDDENDKTTSDGEIKNNKTSGAGGLSESNELWDESKDEGKEAGLRVAAVAAAAPKQSSDVQSSASLSKTMRRGGAAGCSSSEEVSPARKKVLAGKSEPLIGLLGKIRKHRLGSHFERRLRSQESERYKKLVRQHIDLRTIQSTLDTGLYSNCYHRFYRDLLVLFNNFIIFFKKTSQEHAAARELRALVIKEMTDKLRKPKPEHELELPRVVSLSKPSRGGSTMVPCGRRSSVKALSENASGKEKEKPKVNEKKVGVSLLGVEEKGVKKKRSNERSVSGHKNSRSGSNNNNRSNKKGGSGGGGGEVKHQYGNNELSSHDGLDAKLDKKEISMKKRGAASFLRRMKQNSPKKVAESSDEEEEDENDDDDDDGKKDSEDESEDSRLEEEEMKKGRRRNNNNNSKKNNSSNKKKKRDVRMERVTRSSSNSKGRGGGGGEREESGKSGRKVVGRPPKRSAAVGAGERKRGRDNGESELVGVAGGGGKPARKRTRR